MLGFSFWEISTILIVALLVLGPGRVGPMIKALGDALRFLRRASSDLRQAVVDPLEEIKQPLGDVGEQVEATVRSIQADMVRHGEMISSEGGSKRTSSSTDEYAAEREEINPPDRQEPQLSKNHAGHEVKDAGPGQLDREAPRS